MPAQHLNRALAAMLERHSQQIYQTFAGNTVPTVLGMSDEVLADTPLRERFCAIGNINTSILLSFKDKDETPIDEKLIANETTTLIRLSNTIRASRGYHDLVLKISTQSLERLRDSSSYFQNLAQWDQNNVHTRRKLLQQAHEEIIKSAKDVFGQKTKIAKHLRPTLVSLFYRPSVMDTNTGKKLITLGNASTSAIVFPGCEGIGINRHEESLFHDGCATTGFLFHETAHCLEGQLGYLHKNFPKQLPAEIKEDAELFHLRHETKATISSRIHSAYRAQFNEIIAFDVGECAETFSRLQLCP